MFIILRKNDAKRMLELDLQVGRLANDVRALKAEWETELVNLADIKEQVLNTIRRLEQRHLRARKKEEEATQVPDPSDGLDEVSRRVLERRSRRHELRKA